MTGDFLRAAHCRSLSRYGWRPSTATLLEHTPLMNINTTCAIAKSPCAGEILNGQKWANHIPSLMHLDGQISNGLSSLGLEKNCSLRKRRFYEAFPISVTQMLYYNHNEILTPVWKEFRGINIFLSGTMSRVAYIAYKIRAFATIGTTA